jgi:hypothetical protein
LGWHVGWHHACLRTVVSGFSILDADANNNKDRHNPVVTYVHALVIARAQEPHDTATSVVGKDLRFAIANSQMPSGLVVSFRVES